MNNNKSIVPGILIKIRAGIGNPIGDYDNSKDRFYILAEIETEDRPDRDTLVFYGLTEEEFISKSRWHIERYVENGSINLVA